MMEGLRFMPLDLVRLRTFCSVHGLLRCNINIGVHMCARGANISLRDVTIAQMGNGGYRVWVTSRTRSAYRILGILKKWVESSSASGEDGWFLLARRSQASGLSGGGRMCWGGTDGKARIERICISLLMLKNL